MKVTCLLGSPRQNGNSATIARALCDTLAKGGADVQYVALNTLQYRGCQACDACKKALDKCVLKDDLADVLDAVQTSDITVFASPVYYGDVTAQLKALIDRTYSYIVPDYREKIGTPEVTRLNPNAKFVMILTQNASEEKYDDIQARYLALFQAFLNIQDIPLIRACGMNTLTTAKNDADLLREATELAEKLLASEA